MPAPRHLDVDQIDVGHALERGVQLLQVVAVDGAVVAELKNDVVRQLPVGGVVVQQVDEVAGLFPALHAVRLRIAEAIAYE